MQNICNLKLIGKTTNMGRNHSSSSPAEMCCFFRNLILSPDLHLTDPQHAFTKCNVKSIREDRGGAADSRCVSKQSRDAPLTTTPFIYQRLTRKVY